MKHEIIESYDTKEAAVKAGEDYKHWFGYEYTVEPEGGRWKLVARTDQNLMG
jgi:hypothetical protein